MPPIIEATGLKKRFGATQALDGVDITASEGAVLGLLGPNGAGKSTAIRIMTTLTIPDEGTCLIAGHDIIHEASTVRRKIGVAAQDATLDERLTGRENLRMVGQLGRMKSSAAKERAAELLGVFDLNDAADRELKGYSGGMRRRLDLAASMMTRPPVLFLDEPTTGLDPVSRNQVWAIIRGLVRDGVTVLLTTQYLDEADQLAAHIIVIDGGRVIAEGSPTQLKHLTGGAWLDVTLTQPAAAALSALTPLVQGEIVVMSEGKRLHAKVGPTAGLVPRVVRALDDFGVDIEDIAVHQPSLDDVFLSLTGGGDQAAARDVVAAGAAR
jgi:ABC-2 type transport system ATP-binding protein